MLEAGRIPMTETEHKAVEKLLANHDGNATVTRSEPGEKGPLLVHVGDDSYHVSKAGRATKLKAS